MRRRRPDPTPRPPNRWRIFLIDPRETFEHTGRVHVGTVGELYLRNPGPEYITDFYAAGTWRSAHRLNHHPEEPTE